MTTPPVVIAGFSSSSKAPGFVGEVVYGAGPINAASIPLFCLVEGIQLSSGTATANQDVLEITSADQAALAFGAQSELAQMCYAALAVSGVRLLAAGVAEPGGGTAATLTITITLATGTNPVAAGTLQYWLGGRFFSVNFSTSDTTTTIAASIVAQINANPRWPFTAANIANVVTVTVSYKSTRGNDYIAFVDVTKAAGTNVLSGFTGGTTVTGGGIHFSGGAGNDTISSLTTVLFPGQYDFIGSAQYDATNAGLWLAHSQSKAGPLEQRPSRIFFGQQGTLTAAASLAQTTLNDQRSRVIWLLNSEAAPSEIAAVAAAIACQGHQADPAMYTANVVMPGIRPQRAKADWAQRSTIEAALGEGVTPLVTVGNQVQISRGVGTHSLNGTVPDYRTLDWSDDYVPDFLRKDIGLFWATEYVVRNPRVADDPDPTQRARVSGVGTPSDWSSNVQARLQGYEKQGPVGPLPILEPGSTASNPPKSGYDRVGKRIMSLIPLYPVSNQYSLGASLRQVTPA